MTDIRDIALPQPTRVGQGTAIEQSRAVAEVYAAVMIARDMPRSTSRAIRAMEEACAQPELAARAFYAFPRAKQTVQGPSIHLARELARCWGNIQYSVAELRRDDDHGQSEMLAYAWDLESNTRPSAIFIVPHKRDTKDGPKVLSDMRDLYENNANNGARRVRECIFAVLPIWFRERAETLCRETAAKGTGLPGSKPHAERVSNIVKWLETVNVTEADAVRKVGRPTNEWTGADIADLGVLLSSIKQGTVTREEAFPTAVVSGEEIRAAVSDALADTAQEWHDAGHADLGGPRHVWHPECDRCPGRESTQGEPLAVHYYGHTVDFVEGCWACGREMEWKREEANGG